MPTENNAEEKIPLDILSELNRHYDTTFWTVTSIWVTAIGGLLVFTIERERFDMWLSIFGLGLTVCAFFFLASFRSVNRRIQEKMPEEMKKLFRTSPWFRQWDCLLVLFLAIEGMWIRLLVTKKQELTCAWAVFGLLAAGIIISYWWAVRGNGAKQA